MIRLNLVVYLNGVPGSGKDELVEHLRNHFPTPVYNYSSIDCIRKLLGISASDKRDVTRQVLSEVGESLERYNEYRTIETSRKMLERMADRTKDDTRPHIYFVHVRETSIGKKMSRRLQAPFAGIWMPGTIKFTSLFIDRPSVLLAAHAYSNDSDREAATRGREDAQHVLNNDGTLAQLYERGDTLLTELIREYHNHAAVNLSTG